MSVATVVNQDSAGTDVLVTRPSGEREVSIPAFTLRDGKRGTMRRQCTNRWKIVPVRRWLQANRGRRPVELWLGITTDEWQRAKDADVQYITHRFPLLELNMSRADCLRWLRNHGLPAPGKSSCVFCPYLDKRAWETMKREAGDDWRRAVAVDETIRNARLPGQLFVHSRCEPLPDAVSIPEDSGYSQLEMLASDDADAPCDSGFCFFVMRPRRTGSERGPAMRARPSETASSPAEHSQYMKRRRSHREPGDGAGGIFS